MSLKQFDKGYEPHEVEKRWYEYWENQQLFAAEEKSTRTAWQKCRIRTSIIHGSSPALITDPK